jgi:GWxTD domain-containing protein
MLLGALSLVTACAGTHRSSAPAPFSRLGSVWQAWDPQGRPFYEIAISLPWRELRQRQERGDPQIRLIATATIDAGSGDGRSQAWSQQIDRGDLEAEGDLDWSLQLPTTAGKQNLSLAILVQGQPFGSTWSRTFYVPETRPGELFLGEPIFLVRDGDGESWRVHAGRTYDTTTGPPRFRTSVYDFEPSMQGSRFQILVELDDLDRAPTREDLEPVHQMRRELPRAGSITSFEIDLPVLSLGRYEVRLQVQDGERRASSTGQFEVGLTALADLGVGGGGADLLRLLLTPEEADSLLTASPEVREALWEEYWRRRDPDPATATNEARDEMLQRVRYANAHFTTSLSGWRSDRGQVYIRRGAPERVDRLSNREGFDRIERWTYGGSQIVFVFIDRDGRGEYTLLRTNAPDF